MLSSSFRRLLVFGGGVLFALSPLSAQRSTKSAKTTSKTATKPVTKAEQPAFPTFTVKPLPYAEDALAPAISARTVGLHYNKHLKGYATKLNSLVKEKQISEPNLVRLVSYASGSVFDNAGQLLNHTLYFDQFKPYSAGPVEEPQGEIGDAIRRHYGSFAAFQKAFEQAGMEVFGSGWLWLSTSPDGRLYIEKYQGAGSPIPRGFIPLIAIDVWEHAYYLDYENRRADHLKELWHIIDWQKIDQRYIDRAKGVSL